MAAHVSTLIDSGGKLDELDGEVAGAILGAFTYLGGELASEDLAKWFAAADGEAILAGADAGAKFAATTNGHGTRRQGAITGAGVGLLGSYAGVNENGTEEFRDAVDVDLYKDYLEELTRKGIEPAA